MLRKTFWSFLSIIFLITVIYGCTSKRIRTPSGKPEVTIQNVSKKQVIDVLTNWMLTNGYQIKSMTNYNAVYGKTYDSATATISFGLQYNVFPEARLAFTFVESGSNIRVVCTYQMVTNPGSTFEKVNDLNYSKADRHLQDRLDELKLGLEAGQTGRIGIWIEKDGVVLKLIENGPASKAGIRKGDKLAKIGGKPLSAMTQDEIGQRITDEPGTTVALVVKRGNEELMFEVERQILE